MGLWRGDWSSSQRHDLYGEEERCSGYFSCFVTRQSITCLPAPPSYGQRRTLPTGREQRDTSTDAQHCAWALDLAGISLPPAFWHRLEEAGQWKFAKPADDLHHSADLSCVRACARWTLYPLTAGTILTVLIKPRQPSLYLLSLLNVPSLQKAVKQANGHPITGPPCASPRATFPLSKVRRGPRASARG